MTALRSALALGVLVLAGVLAPGSSATVGAAPDASRETVDLEALPRGPRPAFAYLVRTKLYLPSGVSRELSIPPGWDTSRQTLLGPSPRGWVFKDATHGGARLYTVKGKTRARLVPGEYKGFISYRLGLDRRHVLGLEFDYHQDTSTATVFDLTGKVIRRTSFNGEARLLSFTGTRAVVSANRTWDWVIGEPKVPVSAAPSEAADIRRDVLFVPGGDLGHGPTSLSSPGTPAWTAEFRPRLVSPTGSYVVGYTDNGTTLEVRAMSDGSLVRSISTGHRPGAALLWESDDTLAFAGYAGYDVGRALVRCQVAGPCERATPWTGPQNLISVSFQPPRTDG